MNNFSFWKAPINRSMTPTATWSPRDAYDYIVSDCAKARTEELRQLDNNDEKRAYKSKNFDFVTFGGTFSRRANSGLIEPSGLMCIDIDHIGGPTALKAVKKTLLEDPFFHTVLMFVSPSGDGLKWVINVADMMGFTYSDFYKSVVNYLLISKGIVADKTSDIVRACYLPYDPECIFCEDGDDERERETFNPQMWSQMTPALTLSEAKAKKKTESKKNEATDAQDEEQTTACMSYDFANIDSSPRARTYYKLYLRGELEEKVEELVSKLEELNIDIAPSYNEWIKLGFRLVDGLGEEGQDAFVRLSALHPGQQKIDPKQKYQQLLAEGAQRTRIDYFIDDAERAIQAAQPDTTEEADDEIHKFFNTYKL